MKIDRFKDYDPGVRDLVLRFEKQASGGVSFFDVDELEVIMDYYLEVSDDEALETAVNYGENLFPGSGEVRLRKAHLLSIRGQYDEALRILKSLEQTEPDNTDVSYALGAVYGMMGRAQESIDCYQRAAADGYELDMVYGNIGDEYYSMGQLEQAAQYYRKSVEVNPEESRSLYNLASTETERGNGEAAADFFNKLIEDRPYNKWAWFGLGLIYNRLNLYEKGADAYEYALAIDRTLFDAYLGLADCYIDMGDNARAVQTLRDSIDYTDDHAYIYFCIGCIYKESGNFHTATVYLHDALKEDPAYAAAWRQLGICSQKLGYMEEAAGYFRRSIDLDPESDDGWICLADLYIGQERWSEAFQLLHSSYPGTDDSLPFATRICYCLYRLRWADQLRSFLATGQQDVQTIYFSLLATYPQLADDMDLASFLLGYDINGTQNL